MKVLRMPLYLSNLYHAVKSNDEEGGEIFLQEITTFYRDFESYLQDTMVVFKEIGFGRYLSKELKQSYIYINRSFSKWLKGSLLLENVFATSFLSFTLSNMSGLIENGSSLLIEGLHDYENFSREFFSDNVTTFFIYADIENPLPQRIYIEKMILDKMNDFIINQQRLCRIH